MLSRLGYVFKSEVPSSFFAFKFDCNVLYAPVCADAEITAAVVAELRSQNILAGNFYWFENNWHYIRKWDHLKTNGFLNNQSELLRRQLEKYNAEPFVASDAIMSRCISTAISLTWTEEQVKEKGEKIVSIVKKVLENKTALA